MTNKLALAHGYINKDGQFVTKPRYTPQQRHEIIAHAMKLVHKDDDKDAFMEDCIDQLGDEEACELIWDEISGGD